MSTYPAFSVYGVEIELMWVDAATLAVRPEVDRVLEAIAGTPVDECDVTERIACSNELVMHVLELKTRAPSPSLEGLGEAFLEAIDEVHTIMGDDARLLGTADIRWPTVVMNNVWILPGVPEIFRMKLAVVRAHLRGAEEFFGRAVFTLLEEAELKPLLDRVVEAHPEVEVGSYPKWFDPTYRTKVTFDGRQADAVQRALEALLALLPEGEPQRLE